MKNAMNLKTTSAFAAAALAAVAMTLAPAPAVHAEVTYNAALNPGDKFHLVFVTAGLTEATSTDIAYYNALVQAEADGAGLNDYFGQAVTWKAIGSTAAVDARDNIGDPNAPIFNTAGQLVATNEADLWDGTLSSPIQYKPNGSSNIFDVWTGSLTDGTGGDISELGASTTAIGQSNRADSAWVAWEWDNSGGEWYSLYGISSEMTFVPEPGSLALLGLGGLLVARRRR